MSVLWLKYSRGKQIRTQADRIPFHQDWRACNILSAIFSVSLTTLTFFVVFCTKGLFFSREGPFTLGLWFKPSQKFRIFFKFACMGKFLWPYRFVQILSVLLLLPLPLPSDKPAILYWLNLLLNQFRGTCQLSWTSTFRAEWAHQTGSLNFHI